MNWILISSDSNEHCKRELIGDTSLTRRLYARQLCGLYNPHRYEAFRDLVNSTEDRLIVFYNFTEEMERLKGIVTAMNRPVSILSGEVKDLNAYQYQSNSVTFIQYQAGAWGATSKGQQDHLFQPSPRLGTMGAEPKADSQDGPRTPCFYYLLICPGTVEEDILTHPSNEKGL